MLRPAFNIPTIPVLTPTTDCYMNNVWALVERGSLDVLECVYWEEVIDQSVTSN